MAVTSVSAASNYYTQAAAAGPVSIATALAAIRVNSRTKVSISDTSENLARNLDLLAKISNNITGVAQSNPDTVLMVSASQLSKLDTLLGKFSTDYQLDVRDVAAANAATVSANAHVQRFTVTDTGARVSSQLASLQGQTKLASIGLTDPGTLLKVTATQLTANDQVLQKLTGNYGLAVSQASAQQAVSYAGNLRIKSVAISDSAGNISGQLDELKSLGLRLKEIRGNDTNVFEVTADQLQTDALVIGKIYKGFQLSVLGASVNQAQSLVSNKKVVSVDLVDTAANLSAHLDLLKRLGSDLNSVHVTDTDNALTMSSDQFGIYASVLGKIKSDDAYTVAVTGASVSDAQALASNGKVSSIAVSDSSAAIALALSDLQQNTKVASISQVGKLGALAIDYDQYSQLSGADGALRKIQGNYNLSIRAVTADKALSLLAGDSHITSLSVSDSGANLLANLDKLATLGKRLGSIEQSDNTTALSLSVSQWSSYIGTLSKIQGGYSLALSGVSAAKALALASDSRVSSLSVSDSAAAISAQLDTLHGLGAQLTGITQTDAGMALAVTANEWATQSTTLAKLGDSYTLAVRNAAAAQLGALAADDKVSAVAITDSGANIAAQLDSIQAVIQPEVERSVGLSVSVRQVGTGPLRITASQLKNDTAALSAIAGNYSLAVSGVLAAEAHTVGQNGKVVSMTVADSGDHLAEQLADLAALGAKVGSISQTDAGTPLQLKASQWATYSGVLNKVSGGVRAALSEVSASGAQALLADGRVASVAVSDTAAQISANLDKLQSLGPLLTAVAQSDSALIQVRMDQLISAASTLDKLGDVYHLAVSGATAQQALGLLDESASHVQTVAVADTSANIAARLDELQANGKLASITQTGTAAPLNLTKAQWTDNQDALGKIKGSYSVAISDAKAGDVAALAANARVSGMTVTDTASALVGQLDALKAAGNKVSSIVLTTVPASLALTAAQWSAHQTTLGKISTGFSVALSGVSASSAAALAADARVASLAVNDTTARIQANLAALQALGPQLSAITPSETTVPTMTLTAAQRQSSASALSKISEGRYQLAITAATAADVAALALDDKVVSIAVADSSDNIASRLAELNATGKVSQLTQTGDASPMALDADLYAASTATLAKIQGAYSLEVQGATVANATSLQADSHVAAFSVTDTTSAVGAALASLGGMSKLGDINLSEDDGPITLTQSQLGTLSDALTQLQGGYRLNVTGVTLANLDSTLQIQGVSTVALTASSQDVSARFADLVTLGDTVTSIELSNLSTPIALTVDQWQLGAGTLAKVQGDYHLALLDVNAQDATDLAAQAHVQTVSVGDTGANVAAQFDALLALGSQLDAVELTDDEPLVLTQAQVDGGADLLNKFVGAFEVSISA